MKAFLQIERKVSGRNPAAIFPCEFRCRRGSEACRVRVRRITLIEVAIATVLSVLLVATVLSGLLAASEASYAAGQHTAAMGLCQDRMEEMRAVDFEDISGENFPDETGLSLTHTQASEEHVISCSRQVFLQDESTEDIGAKRVRVTVQWTFRGREHEERLETIIYDFH